MMTHHRLTSFFALATVVLSAAACSSEAEPAAQQQEGSDITGKDFACKFLGQTQDCKCIIEDSYTWADAPYHSLEGRIVDDATGKPMDLAEGQHLEVGVASQFCSYDTIKQRATVTSDGKFTLADLECNQSDFRIYLAGTGVKNMGSERGPRGCAQDGVSSGGNHCCAINKSLKYSAEDGEPLPYRLEGVANPSDGYRLGNLKGPITVRVLRSL